MGKHSILIIKNENKEYLQKYIDNWSSYLFLNCKLKDYTDIETVRKYIKEELGVTDFKVDFVAYKIHNKFSQKDKIIKEYIHYFFNVKINEEYTLKEGFKWFSMEELENDKRIMEVNSDIVGHVKKLKL